MTRSASPASALLAASLLATLAVPLPATAQQQSLDCKIGGGLNSFGLDSTGTIDMAQGQSCNLYLRMAGMLQSSAISQRPKNGTLKMIGLANAVYTPKKGFSGSDEFEFTFKGSNQRVTGTSRVRIIANVK